MQYRHSVWFLANPDISLNFCKQFISNDKLLCNKLISAPKDATATWKSTMWGIDMDEIPVVWNESGFSFEVEAPKLLSLMVAISTQNPKLDFTYKYASEELGTAVGNYNITCGKVMEEKKVSCPVRFACALWGVDYADYVIKHREKSRVYASEVAKIAEFVTGEEDEFTDIDNILAQEDG